MGLGEALSFDMGLGEALSFDTSSPDSGSTLIP
ncbi:MAG: hypothetical protein QG655_2603 [Actinomycetota bacterium]|jgi:hypothetical protein|nr:hypothetical protein [Actinomycetota bacterium]